MVATSVKRLVLMLVSAIGAVLLTSCYMMSTQATGAIKLDFAGPAARSISTTATVRVYLYTYSSSKSYSLYTFPGGAAYDSFSYGSGSATISNIPAGLWEVLVSIGSASNGVFSVNDYGDSGVIDVTGGSNTSASVTTTANPYLYSSALSGKNLTAALYDYNGGASTTGGRVLFVGNSSSLYSIPATSSVVAINLSTNAPTPISLPSGLQINSLSEGFGPLTVVAGTSPTLYSVGYCMFINSNEGIVPYTAGAFDTTNFSYSLGATSGSPYSILQSVGVLSNLTTDGTVVYYGRSQGLGGIYFDSTTGSPYSPSNTSGAKWVDVNLSSSVAQNAVYQISTDVSATGKGYAYFATKLGAFRADPSLVQSTSTNAGNLSTTVPITAPNGATIQAIAVDDYDGYLYIGTSTGAYYATLDEASTTSAISGSWTPIAATQGDNIVSIKVDQSSGQLNTPESVAIRSASNNIYTFNAPPGKGGTERTFPFYSGLPGKVNAMDFGLGVLFLAGTEGLASVTIGPLPPL